MCHEGQVCAARVTPTSHFKGPIDDSLSRWELLGQDLYLHRGTLKEVLSQALGRKSGTHKSRSLLLWSWR